MDWLLRLLRSDIVSHEFPLLLGLGHLELGLLAGRHLVLPAALQAPLLLLLVFNPLHVVVGDVADHLSVGLQSHSLGVISNLGEFPFAGLEVCVILHVGLHFGVLGQPLVLRGVRHHGGLRLRNMGRTVGQFVKPFVVLHSELHVADLTPEAVLVPDFLQAFQLLHRVNGFPALRAPFRHPGCLLISLKSVRFVL